MNTKSLFSVKGLLLFLAVMLLSLLCGPCVWEGIRNTHVPTLNTTDNLDDYIHRRISIIGRYEYDPHDEKFGLVHFGDEPIQFYAPNDLRFLKDGDTIRVTGDLLGPAKAHGPLRYPRTLLRAIVTKVQ
jgi:hypothetical protein